MDFLKKFLKNDNTVVGLCELKRKTTLNSFSQYGFNRSFATPISSEIPGGALYTK